MCGIIYTVFLKLALFCFSSLWCLRSVHLFYIYSPDPHVHTGYLGIQTYFRQQYWVRFFWRPIAKTIIAMPANVHITLYRFLSWKFRVRKKKRFDFRLIITNRWKCRWSISETIFEPNSLCTINCAAAYKQSHAFHSQFCGLFSESYCTTVNEAMPWRHSNSPACTPHVLSIVTEQFPPSGGDERLDKDKTTRNTTFTNYEDCYYFLLKSQRKL